MNERRILLVDIDLVTDLLSLLIGDFREAELVAEASGHGHQRPRLKRRHSPVLLVRNDRDVGADRGDRVEERRAVLNAQTVDRVGVITAPDLRCIVQHTGIETSAAAAAALDHDIRVVPVQPLKKIIQTEHVIIEHAALVLGLK